MTQVVDLLVVGASEVISSATAMPPARGPDLDTLRVLTDSAIAVDDGRIVAVGTSSGVREGYRGEREIDAARCVVSPGLVDPHVHLVHAGSRHEEYEAIVTGEGGAAARLEGGINFTVTRTRAASDEELSAGARRDLDLMLRNGVTTIEAKSGYGLDPEHELRLLRIQAGLDHAVDIVPTYLGAHVVPSGVARDGYVAEVIATLSEARALAEYCDVFCDPAAFSIAETRAICEAAMALGFRIRLHADQTGPVGAAELAAELGAASADHLDHVSSQGIAALAEASVTAVVLPAVALHMMEVTPGYSDGSFTAAPKQDLVEVVHRMKDACVPLALSTDYNPGTSPTPSMPLAMQLAARLFRLGYAAIWNMATVNAAYALDRADDRGLLEPGMRADLVVWDVPHHGMVINRLGYEMARTVIKNGAVAYERV
ncbi:MAG: imidazolonepropionase [Acidimicrobiia bacterium]